jgi:valyl-tRNA synthetase
VASNAKPTIVVQTANVEFLSILKQEVDVISSLVKASETLVISDKDAVPEGCVKGFVSDETFIYVKVIGLIDISLEVGRINKRVKQLEDMKSKLEQKINIPDYINKVPEKVRNENAEKMAGSDVELAEVLKQVALMEKFL